MRRLAILLALWGCDDGSARENPDSSTDPDQWVDPGHGGCHTPCWDEYDPDMDLPDGPPVAADELIAEPGESRYGDVGRALLLDGSNSVGAVSYQWNFGDGRSWEEPREDPFAEVTYLQPGRYQATLTVFDAVGNRHTAGVTISITMPVSHSPNHSSTVLGSALTGSIYVVVPDDDAVMFLGPDMRQQMRWPTCHNPRTIALWGGDQVLVVTCPNVDLVRTYRFDSGEDESGALPLGSAPIAAVGTQHGLYVALNGTGQVVRFQAGDGVRLELTDTWDVVEDPRGIAELPDGRIAVTRWRSPNEGAEIGVLDPQTGAVETWRLAFDPQPASDTEIGGVPSYLDQIVVSPTGSEITLPSLQANVLHGPTFDGEDPAHDTVLRGIVSFIDPTTGEERFEARRQFDNRGFASAVTYSDRGDFLFVATRGSRTVERVDRLTDNASGTFLDVGFAPDGLVVMGNRLFVNASLSRKLVVYDLGDGLQVPLDPMMEISTVDEEPLPANILRGKQLFNDSFDIRLSRDGYMACAHCHLDGDSDRFVWDFTSRGEGRRNTISLLGRNGAHGLLHWSANFDEVQDFEHDIRGPFGGLGLIDAREIPESLAAPKAGLSGDLDALSAYVVSLDRERASPFPPTSVENGFSSSKAVPTATPNPTTPTAAWGGWPGSSRRRHPERDVGTTLGWAADRD